MSIDAIAIVLVSLLLKVHSYEFEILAVTFLTCKNNVSKIRIVNPYSLLAFLTFWSFVYK